MDTLKKHEYNITQKTDISDLRDVEAYKIILCDIRGVGKFLTSEFGGAYLIKQLKEKYPEKTIIAYTASNYDANDTISKGDYALEDWTSLLDRLLNDMSDPQKMWERARKALTEAGISTLDIAKYESDYVKAIEKGKFESFQKLYENKSDRGSEIMLALAKTLPTILSLVF